MQVFLVFVIVAVSYSAGDRPQKYCGRRLADARAVICGYTTEEEKKSIEYNEVEYDAGGYSWPWLQAHKAIVLAQPRNKRGIVEECCEKPCSINELLSYC